MVIIKRLYMFMLQRFLPVLAMTFFICLFIVMMQFLWRYIDDLVGKGLGIGVVAELFGYAALTMVPTALPLAVLLASLMTFGNLGEKFELTAMKAAGISLFRIMRPLIILMVLIAVGAFFFQNNLLPIAQTKMWTLLFSMRQKSPEVEIPVRSFYDQIPGMNLYVENKNMETGMLYDMIIYDVSRGMDNARVILADSGKMNFTEDKSRLFLHLYRGEMFENLQNSAQLGMNNAAYLPFRRESFTDKQVYIAFDANFNRIDESGMRSQYIGKNISELTYAIDSLQTRVDSIGNEYGHDIRDYPYMGLPYYTTVFHDNTYSQVRRPQVHPRRQLNVDSVFTSPNPSMAKAYLTQAISRARQQQADFEFKSAMLFDQQKLVRRHDIERQKKFTLSFACLIFFFIGAPLGAIIKKGGLGTPLVISVLLFVVYFIFDNMGYKLARDGKLEVWTGIWLSSMVMLPLGIFFTYKAVGDSAVFDIDAYMRVIRRLFGISPRRNIAFKEIVMESPSDQEMLDTVTAFDTNLRGRIEAIRRKPFYSRHNVFTRAIRAQLEELVVKLSYARDPKIIKLLNEYPSLPKNKNAKTVLVINEEIMNILRPREVSETYTHDDTEDNA